MSPRRPEDGFGTLFAIAMSGVLVFVALICTGIAGVVSTHRMAQAAADLSALAGASAAQQGSDPCGIAGAIARRNQARLTSCTVRGSEVTVQVRVRSPKIFGDRHDLRARARAGPAQGAMPGVAPAPIR